MVKDRVFRQDQEEVGTHLTLLEERHLETYRDLQRLREALCHRYTALLKQKVHTQRLTLKQREDTKRGEQGDSEEEFKQRQRKKVFSRLQHNDSYLQSVPKTCYYQIFDLQKQLVELGRLKTHRDIQDFHCSLDYSSRPSQLQRSLKTVREKMMRSKCAAEPESVPPTAGDEDDVCYSRSMEIGSDSGERQEKDAVEQMFPKIKVPTFTSLQPSVMKNFQSKMPDLTIPAVPEKSRKAEVYFGCLRQMHQTCLSNMLFSQRLLDTHTDSLCWRQQQGAQALILPALDSKPGKNSQTQQPAVSSQKQRAPRVCRAPPPQQRSRTSSARSKKHRNQQCCGPPVEDISVVCRHTPDPLSMEDVCKQKHTQVIDCGMKLWRNYTETTE
ncbi:uncharacterized protein LOC112487887 [Cynoglossus semilaevis]|uniref:uncharacterized protein LOC112487887 n=1 Tax=Cynoglossus semilaevis TaxID=244447 RepID=UPI000D62D6B6|nr:uncharacterized protein LOC112487887 [Cynoglossus semilaevis]